MILTREQALTPVHYMRYPRKHAIVAAYYSGLVSADDVMAKHGLSPDEWWEWLDRYVADFSHAQRMSPRWHRREAGAG